MLFNIHAMFSPVRGFSLHEYTQTTDGQPARPISRASAAGSQKPAVAVPVHLYSPTNVDDRPKPSGVRAEKLEECSQSYCCAVHPLFFEKGFSGDQEPGFLDFSEK